MNDEPIRLKFGGQPKPEQLITNDEVRGMKADQQVSSLDGRGYAGDTATGRLELMGGSARSKRRQHGLSGRQWKQLAKKQRRGSRPTDARQKAAAQQRLEASVEASERFAADEYPRSPRSARSRRVSSFFSSQPMVAGVDYGAGDDSTVIVERDDLGNVIAHDLGERDLGEHGE